MKKLENAVMSYLQDGFSVRARTVFTDWGFRYVLVSKGDTFMLIMSNGAYLFEKKIRLVNNIAKYARRKFYELIFNQKIEEYRLRHYFVKIIARVDNYTVAKAQKATFENNKCSYSVAYIMHKHGKDFDVAVSSSNPLENCR